MPVHLIDVNAAHELLSADDAVLIDVRERTESAEARIDGAALVPLALFTAADIPDTDKKVIIHCKKGGRSQMAAERACAVNPGLIVYNMVGGMDEWLAAGLPHLSDKS